LGDNRAFGPEHLNAIETAFSAALNKLGLHDLKDPMTEMIARRIIQAAFRGERDPIKLREIGMDGGRKAAGGTGLTPSLDAPDSGPVGRSIRG
jgi:hypothetical protein